jgi:hypothetical protein
MTQQSQQVIQAVSLVWWSASRTGADLAALKRGDISSDDFFIDI